MPAEVWEEKELAEANEEETPQGPALDLLAVQSHEPMLSEAQHALHRRRSF